MPGSTSISESYRVALEFTKIPKAATNPEMYQQVLFVICLQNYKKFYGFRMNSALYSAHPQEKEVLLIEGAEMAVMGLEDFYIDNQMQTDTFWDDCNQKTITVVYLFPSSWPYDDDLYKK